MCYECIRVFFSDDDDDCGKERGGVARWVGR